MIYLLFLGFIISIFVTCHRIAWIASKITLVADGVMTSWLTRSTFSSGRVKQSLSTHTSWQYSFGCSSHLLMSLTIFIDQWNQGTICTPVGFQRLIVSLHLPNIQLRRCTVRRSTTSAMEVFACKSTI